VPHLPFTLRQLDVFSTLCATWSFRGTAERLGISQASVSNQLKALEEQLGVRLFARTSGKRPTSTAAGRGFLDDVTAFNAAAQALAAHRRSSELREQRLNLRIRVGRGLTDNYIRPKLNRFLIDNPDITLEFAAQLPNDKGGSDVEAGGFDFALLHLREDHPVRPIFREVALLRGGIYGHRSFAEGHEVPMDPELLSKLPFILPREGSPEEREVHVALRRAGITPRKVVCHTQYFDVIATLLGQGLGVASFAEVILPPDLREAVILLRPLLNWRLIWYRRDKGSDARYDKVEDFLLSSLLNDSNYPVIKVLDPASARRRAKQRERSLAVAGLV
jgi:DNA-binding transcriptional LysR family regulator